MSNETPAYVIQAARDFLAGTPYRSPEEAVQADPDNLMRWSETLNRARENTPGLRGPVEKFLRPDDAEALLIEGGRRIGVPAGRSTLAVAVGQSGSNDAIKSALERLVTRGVFVRVPDQGKRDKYILAELAR